MDADNRGPLLTETDVNLAATPPEIPDRLPKLGREA